MFGKNKKNQEHEPSAEFKAVFDNAIDGILIADSKTQKFVMANKAMCEMLGYPLEKIKTLGVPDIHPPKDLPFVLEQFARQARKEISLAQNLPVKKSDGSIFFADINAFPITIGGKEHLAGFFRDITERKNMEQQLREKVADLEQTNRLMVGRELKMEELKKEIKDLKK